MTEDGHDDEQVSGDGERPSVVASTLILADKKIMLTRSDGKVAFFPMKSLKQDETSRVARVSYLVDRNILYVETDRQDAVVLELPTASAEAPIEGRSVIYLDQNHWSTLAKIVYDASRVSRSELEAGSALIRAVAQRQILLPVSAGHMSETCKWEDSEARYKLGLTILKLSAGWQLRDPLDLRRRELIAALVARFGGSAQSPVAPVTLASDAVHAGRDREWFAPRPVMSETEFAVGAMTSATVLADVLLDEETVALQQGSGWIQHLQDVTDWLASSGKDKQQKRKIVDGLFLADIKKEVAEAAAYVGIVPEQLEEWITTYSDDDISSSATLSIFRQIIRDKVADSQTTWEANDLFDIFYLSCAAGHVDHVVCEKRAASNLLQARKRGYVRANVYRSLRELVKEIGL